MKKIRILSVLLALSVSAFAHDNGNDNHNSNDNAHHNDKECKEHKDCHKHCSTNFVTITKTVTNQVYVTNLVTQVVLVTNVVDVTVTNYVTSSLVDLPTAEYPVEANHTYNLMITSDESGRWVRWGKVKATDTEVIRLLLPIDLAKNVYWQLVDSTPGFPKAAIQPVEPTTEFRTTILALVKGKVYKLPTITLP